MISLAIKQDYHNNDYLEVISDSGGIHTLSEWVCDKISDSIIIRDSFGNIIVMSEGYFILNGEETNDLLLIRETIGSSYK